MALRTAKEMKAILKKDNLLPKDRQQQQQQPTKKRTTKGKHQRHTTASSPSDEQHQPPPTSSPSKRGPPLRRRKSMGFKKQMVNSPVHKPNREPDVAMDDDSEEEVSSQSLPKPVLPMVTL